MNLRLQGYDVLMERHAMRLVCHEARRGFDNSRALLARSLSCTYQQKGVSIITASYYLRKKSLSTVAKAVFYHVTLCQRMSRIHCCISHLIF